MTYFQVRFRLPAAHEDLLVGQLLAMGALGFESTLPDQADGINLKAFFDVDPDTLGLDELELEIGVERLGTERIPERDWLAEYRATAVPFELGRRFLIDPRDPDDAETEIAPESGRHLLKIPAQTAFGTGSHESTQLAVDWLEALDLEGKSVLDVGTGSGILCFVAEKLGASWSLGYDIDPEAIWIARQNARRNGCQSRFLTTRAAAFRHVPIFDLLVINELPERILPDYPELLPTLHPGGQVISSGNLLERRAELLESFAALDLTAIGERTRGEWISFLLRRP